MVIFCMNYEGKYYVHEFWAPRMREFVKSTIIGTRENKAIHSITLTWIWYQKRLNVIKKHKLWWRRKGQLLPRNETGKKYI